MSTIQIRKARRAGARLVIMLAGVSGSGKTRTALEIAYGLTNRRPEKIGFLDAENRRGSLFADVFADPERPDRTDEEFQIADLYAPFTPQRYIDAIHAFQRAGVEVLIIDSGSHEWEGIGGCIEIAEAGNPKLPNWNKAKGEHKRFMNALLTCDMHIILCLRAREKAKPEKKMVNGQEKTVYVPLGLQAITEQNVLFEATASIMLHDEGRRRDIIKCPDKLLPFLGHDRQYITADDGVAVRRWVDGGEALDPEIERARNSLISICEQGLAALEKAWKALTAKQRKALGPAFLEERKASAAAYERLAKEAKGQADDASLDALNDAVGAAVENPLGDDPSAANDNQPPDDDEAAAD